MNKKCNHLAIVTRLNDDFGNEYDENWKNGKLKDVTEYTSLDDYGGFSIFLETNTGSSIKSDSICLSVFKGQCRLGDVEEEINEVGKSNLNYLKGLFGYISNCFSNFEATKSDCEFSTLLAVHWGIKDSLICQLWKEVGLRKKDDLSIVSYTRGGTGSVAREMNDVVTSIENGLVGFETSFNELWCALRRSSETNHLLQSFISKICLEWYHIGKDKSDLKTHSDEFEQIINTFHYLLNGETSQGNIHKAASEIFDNDVIKEYNLSKTMLSDFSWGFDAKELIDKHLKKLDIIDEIAKPEIFRWCREFSDVLSRVAEGKGLNDS